MKDLLIDLTKEEKARLITKTFKRNEILFHENEFCNSISIVVKGRIDILSYTYEGSEILYNSLTENMMFGNNLIFSSNPKYKGDAISKENSEVIFIYKDVLIDLLQNNKGFLLKFLNYQSDFGKELNSKIKLLSLDSAEERLLFLLQQNNGNLKIQSVTSLASTLNLKRETVSRLLTKLEKKHVIKRASKSILLIKD